ncbi:recombinase family protein [Kocuria salina]|nr:recombinase family protein [Kocuria salina]
MLGYAQVSTTSQNLDVQLRALTEARVPAELVFTDKISGTQAERPGLAALMAEAEEGDTLVLYSLDRLGRSLVHVVTTIDELIRRGVALSSLTDTIDTTTGVRPLPAQRVCGHGRVPTGADRGTGPGRLGGRPGPRGAAGAQIPDHPGASPRYPPAAPGGAAPLQDPPPGGGVQGGCGSGAARGD